MKKSFSKILLALLAAGFLLSTASCKKCRECAAYEMETGILYDYQAFCDKGSGASANIDEWEANFRAEHAGYIVYCNATNKQ